MVLWRGVGRNPVLGAYVQMFGPGISCIGKCSHAFYTEKFFGIKCHWGKGMGIVGRTCIVVHEEIVFGIAACLYIVTHIDDVTVQYHGLCIGVGKTDLRLAALLQLFFYIFLFWILGKLFYPRFSDGRNHSRLRPTVLGIA